jgi:tetraacyldisaccharide 4'-kinase
MTVTRVEDVVLVSADRWREPLRELPAGPWREGLDAFRRASFLIVTRKAADFQSADTLLRRLLPLTVRGSGAIAALELGEARNVATGEIRTMTAMQRAPVLVIAGIGDPVSFELQLRSAGLDVTMRVFPDHHVYRAEEVDRLVREGSAYAHVICTLKDAVKLGQLWPREGPSLWYVSLRCRIESGEADVAAMLDRLVARHLKHNSGARTDGSPPTPSS